MSNVLILNNNYLDEDTLTEQTYGSQVSTLPATNLLSKKRRSKVYRSQGYWNVTSTNNKIIFRESVGVDLTATITVAEYVSDSTFLTAIKTALEATGASTYTVTRDTTTNKIKITSDGLGGGGVFQLMWTDVNSTAAGILGFDTGANDTGALTYTADTLKIHTSEWIRWDLGVSSNPSAFVILGLRNEAIKLSGSAVITLQGNTTDAWTSPLFEQVLTYSEDAISFFSTAGFGAYRYWRLKIEDPSNSYGYIELSKIYLGETVEPAQGAVQFPFSSRYLDFAKIDRSEMGVVFSTERQQSQEFTLDWFGLSVADAETLDEFVKFYGLAYPFFVCLDPNEVFSSDLNKWVKYCRFSEVPELSLVSPGIFSARWVLTDEV